jgi:hypothetical protein
MVGQQTLTLLIGVRVPVSQPFSFFPLQVLVLFNIPACSRYVYNTKS